MIPIGKFGFLVLDINLSPSLVDVNVHPAKLEVRFVEEQTVFKAVYYAIQDTLLKAELIANSETQITGKLEKEKTEEKTEAKADEDEGRSTIANLFRKIAKNTNYESEFGSNNVIESIYNSKIEGQEENKTEEVKGNVLNFEAARSTEEQNEVSAELRKEEPEEANIIEENKKFFGEIESFKAQEEFEKPEEAEKVNSAKFELPSSSSIYNKDEIKNKIDEFMKKGKSLTAEDIRESLAALSLSGKPTETSSPKIETEGNKEEVKRPVSENVLQEVQTENYETKEIEIPNIENQNLENTGEIPLTPGEILTNLAQERTETENAEESEEKKEQTFEEKFDDMYAQIFGKPRRKEQEEEEKSKNTKNDAEDIAVSSENVNLFEESEQYKDDIPYRFIGIAFKTYIILEIEKELYILDQHAAHERIMYEKVKNNYYSEEEKDSQLMLLPDIITLTHKEMDIARENMDKFQKAGFVLEEFGDNTIKLTGVPNICLDLDTKELFLETLDEINTVARTAKQEIEERFIATIACKAAVKANMALTEEEVISLLDDLLKLPNPFTCPHGRPTAIKLSKTDIEKKFARRK
ncbi:MAG: hypothetical protein HFJ54_05175 [Clostridia bacterium]|nr:hypothetical protein [Clostridia bacterium]